MSTFWLHQAKSTVEEASHQMQRSAKAHRRVIGLLP
jgi:hypothetical protein